MIDLEIYNICLRRPFFDLKISLMFFLRATILKHFVGKNNSFGVKHALQEKEKKNIPPLLYIL
jgi:hypothetical protein